MERGYNGRHEYGWGRRGEGEIRPASRGAQRADAAELAGDVDGDGVGEARFTSGRLGRGLSGRTTEQEHYPLGFDTITA